MRLQVSFDVPADAHATAAMLADPDFVAASVRATGAVDSQVDVVPGDAGAFTVTTRRWLPADDLPAPVRTAVGPRLEIRLVEAWEPARADGSRTGTVVVEIVGAPVRITGASTLGAGEDATAGEDAAEDATTVGYDGEVKASVPLFGQAVEQAAADAVRQALLRQGEVARRWAAGDRG